MLRFFLFNGPSSTTAADYTSAEVREIIRLLREDDECRDTRISDFSRNNNSLELWEKILGRPVSVTGRDDSPDWTFATKDGALSIHVGVYETPDGVPYVGTYTNGESSIGINANDPVDSADLKRRILSIKQHIDPRDSLAFQQELEEKWQQEQTAWDEQQAEEAKQLAEHSDQIREELESERDRAAADQDFIELRDAMPVGPEKNAFSEIQSDWIERRTAVITKARKNGALPIREAAFGQKEIVRELPLPDVDDVIEALRNKAPVPVDPIGNENKTESQPEQASHKPPDTASTADNPAPNSVPDKTGNSVPTSSLTQTANRQAVYEIDIGWKHVFRAGDRETLDRILAANPEWRLIRTAFSGLQKELSGTVPLYRYGRRNDGRHTYLVADQTPVNGFQKEGDGSPLVWVWRDQKDGTVSLYLLGAPKRDIRTLAVGETERDRLVGTGEWREHRKLGYVYPSENKNHD
ncbi:MAG: hypothetical protein HUJ26_04475 [Planctomycetaceae bacterium]|nr:hypothetical protein [Planctomycetaceae bacterium]